MTTPIINQDPCQCKIVLEVHRIPTPSDELCGQVKITEDAEIALRQIARASGLSLRQVASQMIIQGAALVEIREVR